MFKVRELDDKRRSWTFEQDAEVFIGRDSLKCAIAMSPDAPGVSRVHSMLCLKKGVLQYTDNSSCGSHLNGIEFHKKKQQVHQGDVLLIGEHRLIIEEIKTDESVVGIDTMHASQCLTGNILAPESQPKSRKKPVAKKKDSQQSVLDAFFLPAQLSEVPESPRKRTKRESNLTDTSYGRVAEFSTQPSQPQYIGEATPSESQPLCDDDNPRTIKRRRIIDSDEDEPASVSSSIAARSSANSTIARTLPTRAKTRAEMRAQKRALSHQAIEVTSSAGSSRPSSNSEASIASSRPVLAPIVEQPVEPTTQSPKVRSPRKRRRLSNDTESQISAIIDLDNISTEFKTLELEFCSKRTPDKNDEPPVGESLSESTKHQIEEERDIANKSIIYANLIKPRTQISAPPTQWTSSGPNFKRFRKVPKPVPIARIAGSDLVDFSAAVQ